MLGTSRERADFLGQIGEFPIHQRTKVRERTSRINKRKYNHLAPQIGKLDHLTVLSGHGEVGNRFSNLELPRSLTQGDLALGDSDIHMRGCLLDDSQAQSS